MLRFRELCAYTEVFLIGKRSKISNIESPNESAMLLIMNISKEYFLSLLLNIYLFQIEC